MTGFTFGTGQWRFRRAGPNDVSTLVGLINSAYRGDSSRQGWTTEADLLDGQRTDGREVGRLIRGPNSAVFVLEQPQAGGQRVLGCFSLQCPPVGLPELGMFVIRPGLQGLGLGRRCLRFARRYLRLVHQSPGMRMLVIERRLELIAYYERLGFRNTGRVSPFPNDPRFGVPKVSGLQFVELEQTWRLDRGDATDPG